MNIAYYACGLAGLLAAPAAAQTAPDTTRLKYGEEAAAAGAPAAPLRVQQQARGLWKLGLNNFLLGAGSLGPGTYYTRYGLHLAYERRLGRAWSVQAEASPALAHYRLDPAAAVGARPLVRLQLAGRYYYNLERRLRRGRRTDNFAANYVAGALGTGTGGPVRETPYYLLAGSPGAVADAAVLYGLQRRLGRRGYLDASVGVSGLLCRSGWQVNPNGALRVGLVLGPQPVAYAPRPVPAADVSALLPRFYAGAHIGGYYYRVHYAGPNPYPPTTTTRPSPAETLTTYYPGSPRDGYGTYAQYVAAGPLPYVYVGYYLAPRWALQVGVQKGGTLSDAPLGTYYSTATGPLVVHNQTLDEQGLAVPVLLRYALTPAFLRRLQFNAVGGLVPVWSSVDFREYQIVDRQVTSQETLGFQRRAFGLHATLGLDASYGFGRRRRVQATTELLVNKDVRTFARANDEDLQNGTFLAGGFALGLRYRFGYR